MLIRKLGGADALRASLKQFEMREDGTIEREWLEGKFAIKLSRRCLVTLRHGKIPLSPGELVA